MMVKVGILGFAHGHVFSYAPQWIQHPEWGVQVIGGWDEDAQRRAASCEKLGIKAFGDADALLEACDAVVISSETAFHAPLIIRAANAKKDIMCYKPLALRMEEADRIVEAVEKNGVRFTMGWQMRTDPQNLKIKALIDDGSLGRVYHFRRRHCLGTHLWADFRNTWHNNPKLNRDIFADDAAHAVNLMQFLFGMPEEVSCTMTTVHSPAVPNDNALCTFTYPGGMLADISCCFRCAAAAITTEVYAEKGAVQQYFGDGPATRLPHGTEGLRYFIEGDTGWTVSDIPSPKVHGERLAWQAGPMADFFTGRSEGVCSAREGRDTLRLILCCYLSQREGRRVKTDDPRVYEF